MLDSGWLLLWFSVVVFFFFHFFGSIWLYSGFNFLVSVSGYCYESRLVVVMSFCGLLLCQVCLVPVSGPVLFSCQIFFGLQACWFQIWWIWISIGFTLLGLIWIICGGFICVSQVEFTFKIIKVMLSFKFRRFLQLGVNFGML